MDQKTKILAYLLAILLLVFSAAAQGTITVNSITFNPNHSPLREGTSYSITVEYSCETSLVTMTLTNAKLNYAIGGTSPASGAAALANCLCTMVPMLPALPTPAPSCTSTFTLAMPAGSAGSTFQSELTGIIGASNEAASLPSFPITTAPTPPASGTVTIDSGTSVPGMTAGNSYVVSVKYSCHVVGDTLTNQVFNYDTGSGYAAATAVTFGGNCPCDATATPAYNTCSGNFNVNIPVGSSSLTFRITGDFGLSGGSGSATSQAYPVLAGGGPPPGPGGCIEDGYCDVHIVPPETCTSCLADCGPCPAVCGLNGCEATETPLSCPADCAASPVAGPRPITIQSIETCPEGPADGKLQKNTEYAMRIRFTTATPVESLKAYYCLTAPLPYGSEGICKVGTHYCPMNNQVACPSGECTPENCSGAAACTCEAKIKIPWAVPTAGIVLVGDSLGVGQGTTTPVNYEVISPVEAAAEGAHDKQLLVYGGSQSFACESVGVGQFPGCAYDFSCNGAVTDAHPVVRCRDCSDCKVKCAQACGEHSTCMATASATCEACCDSTTCGKGTYIAYDFWKCLIVPCYISDQESCACKQACRGECEANTSFCNTIRLLRIIAGIAAAIMLVIQALRYVMSDEPMDRQNAKEGIWYVLIGALLIAIASGLVGYFFMEGLIC